MAKKPTKPPTLTLVSNTPKKGKVTPTPQPAEKNKGGRPPHQPTPQTRGSVVALKGAGFSDKSIAHAMQLGLTTLKAHYAEDLEMGRDKAHALVAMTLFRVATDPQHPKCITANIFYSKAHMGLKDDGSVPVDEDGDMKVVVIGIGGAKGA